MSSVVVGLLPLIVGAAVVPVWIIMVLFLLRSEGGLLKAVALRRAASRSARAGHAVGYIFRSSAESSGEGEANLIVSTLLW